MERLHGLVPARKLSRPRQFEQVRVHEASLVEQKRLQADLHCTPRAFSMSRQRSILIWKLYYAWQDSVDYFCTLEGLGTMQTLT